MRVPHDWSGEELIKRLQRLGYHPTRQSGGHVRLTRSDEAGDHHLTVPMHDPVRVGTLSAILRDVASSLHISKEELLRRLQG